jgi:hypothetical protein
VEPLHKRLAAASTGDNTTIQTICQASIRIPAIHQHKLTAVTRNDMDATAKLDTCAAVSLSHRQYLRDIRHANRHGRQPIRLRGIGGKDNDVLDKIGKLRVRKQDGNIITILCYVFDKSLAGIEHLCLIGMSDIHKHSVDILHHIGNNLQGKTSPLRTIANYHGKAATAVTDIFAFDAEPSISQPQTSVRDLRNDLQNAVSDRLVTDMYPDTPNVGDPAYPLSSVFLVHDTDLHSHVHDEYICMTEIQLQHIVNRLAQDNKHDENTDGQESMVKNGRTISKFCREAMYLGEDTGPEYTSLMHSTFDKYSGDDMVFPTRNGCPKILTLYKDKPYSYELLPEYASGEKALPQAKAPHWDRKPATTNIIRKFVATTPVVSPCRHPLCVSRLVIVPKFAPGQLKTDPDHGFRVTVNSLMNKCLKTVASTIPLAADEIKKLYRKKYYLQVDGDECLLGHTCV